jgi:aspartate racemase
MKKIGLIGGLSWISSREYYSILNTEYNLRKGNNHSCPIVLYSLDFNEVEVFQHDDNWIKLGEIMSEAAIKVEKGGADLVLICSNTMHFCAEAIQSRIMIPVLHIADSVGSAIAADHLTKVGLMGTRYLMKMPMYSHMLRSRYSIETMLPEEKEIEIINKIIYEELIHGLVNDDSREQLMDIAGNMINKGAEGLILGCTELPMIFGDAKLKIPVYNTTRIHALYGLDFAMKEHLYA